MPVSILLLAASPADRVQLALDPELDLITRAIRLGSLRDRFEVRTSQATRADELLPLLLEARPTVVQFSGHGTAGEGLIFEDGAGASAPLPADLLRQVFAELPGVRCVVLNACYSVAQATAIAEHVPAVVAMNDQVSDAVATAFSGVFYQALAEGHALRSAFELGVAQVRAVDAAAQHVPQWIGGAAAGDDVLAAQPEQRWEVARRLYETEFIALARSVSALLDDDAAGSVVEEVFGEFVVGMPPVEAGAELAWLQGRVIMVAGERVGPPVATGNQRVDQVLAAIRALPLDQSRLLLYRYYHGHTDDEIAALVGMPTTTVAATVDAAMASVAARLGSVDG